MRRSDGSGAVSRMGPSKYEWHTPILIAPSTSIPDRKSSLLTDLVGTHIAAQLRVVEDQNGKNICIASGVQC